LLSSDFAKYHRAAESQQAASARQLLSALRFFGGMEFA
jgi:hypothetical protein